MGISAPLVAVPIGTGRSIGLRTSGADCAALPPVLTVAR
jgi:hypothetical protein